MMLLEALPSHSRRSVLLCGVIIMSLVSVPFGKAFSQDAVGHWLYVTLLREKKIVCFQRMQDGSLQRRGETPCAAEPACLGMARDRRTLYVAYRSSGQIAAFRIHATTGELTLLNVVAGGDDPAYLLPDRTGHYLLSAYYESNKVAVHPLTSAGAVGEQPLLTIPTAEKAHGIAIHPNNQWVFVSHTGSDRIYQFRLDEKTGKLTPNQPAFVSTPTGEHPRHIMLHPTGRWAYVSNEASDSLGVFEVNQATGALRRKQTLSSLPPGVDGQANATARCELTPDGRCVYIANRGHDSIACYGIDQDTGRATLLEIVPTEKTPRSFSIDPAGKFLYAAGQGSGKVAVFGIAKSGRLRRQATTEAGPVAWWALAVDVPQ